MLNPKSSVNTNFKRNLLIGFSASLIILLISSVASFVSIQNLLKSAELVDHTNEVIKELGDLNASLVDAETAQRGYILIVENASLQLYSEARARASEHFAKVERLTSDNPNQQVNVSQMKTLMNERLSLLQEGVDRKMNNLELDLPTLRNGRLVMDRVRSLVKRMQDEEQRLLVERTDTMNQFAFFTPPLILVAAFAAVLITIAFYVKVRNDFDERLKLQFALQEKDADITNRIGIIQGIADKISQGSYSIRVDDKQSDSLGAVAGSLNRMASSLEYSFSLLSEKEWLQTGIAHLNNVMIGEKDVDRLSKDVVDFVAQYTNSNVGAIYLLEKGELNLSGGFAFAANANRKTIQVGQGLLGQAVETKKPIEIKNVPAENISVSYAAGEIKPTNIIAIPILDGYTVKGGIELARINEFTKRDLNFLTEAAPNIGIAINTAQNRRRLQELLEETQAQSEELRTQHSELENLNSELEVQASKLQASEEELKVQQEELKQANMELEERSRLLEEKNQMISERNLDIQNKADELAQSAKYKSEFLANMSHELRTPLNSILLLSRLMSENQEKNLTPDQIEYARVIQSSGHGLLSLIDEILDLSKIEAGKMSLEYQSVSVNDIVNNMKSLFQPVASEKGIEFKTKVAKGMSATLETDQGRLEQIIRNLLSNAIKFTSKGYVSLEVVSEKSDDEFIQFIVSDTGIGIAEDKQRMVFEAFQQADGSTRRKYGGTGLGLSISKELARLLGGEIRLKSQVNEGSEFVVVVPVKKRVQNQQAKPEERSVTESFLPEPKKPVRDVKYISPVIPENIPDDRAKVSEDDKVILIVEDDVSFAKSLLEYTRSRGYKGVVAVRGDEGIDLAKKYLPVGVLLDIQLPVKSGWEVMEDLKNDAHTRHIPVHIMSSHQVKNESLMKGAVDFINKPFAFEKMQDVFQKIEHVLMHHPKKVLIVEENTKHAKALAYFLETFEVNIEINHGVDDAISSLKNSNVNCVILDMGIPDQKAYDTLEEVKKTKGLENIPIIIFTGKSLSQAEEMRIKQYADSIVVKTAHSYKRILDEVSLFLHLMEKNGNEDQPSMKNHKLGGMDEVLKNKTVLVADDDMRNIFSMTKALEKFQMNVIAAVDGKDALEKLKENPSIDIVLMDMMMPEMDGYESTSTIRKNPKYRNLPIIAVTAKAMMGDRAKCIEAGASDYISKPVDVDQLLSLLRVWLYEKVHK